MFPTKNISPLRTKAFQRMKLDIQEISDDTLSIFLWNPDAFSLQDSNRSSSSKELSANSSFVYSIFSPETFIEVKRRIDNRTIFSTSRGPLIVSENFFEWSVYLNSIELMGLDELQLKEGQRILINNEHSSIVPYVLAFGRHTFPL